MNRKERRKFAKQINTPQNLEAFGKDLERKIRKEYDEMYKEEIGNSIDNMLLAIKYTLHFSQLTQFGNKRVSEFIEDLNATFAGFSSGEYKPQEYARQLREDKIYVKDIYKEE